MNYLIEHYENYKSLVENYLIFNFFLVRFICESKWKIRPLLLKKMFGSNLKTCDLPALKYLFSLQCYSR